MGKLSIERNHHVNDSFVYMQLKLFHTDKDSVLFLHKANKAIVAL